MNALLERFTDPTFVGNPQVYMVTIVAIAVGLGALHARVTRRPMTTGSGEPEKVPTETHDTGSIRRQRPSGPLGRFDARFERMVYRTQSGLRGIDASALIALTTTGGATLGFFISDQWWPSLLGGIVGLVIPLVVLKILSSRYHRQLQKQLPDLFYMLSRFLRGGLTLPQSLHQAAMENLQPLSSELDRVNRSVDLGMSVQRSLNEAARRIQLTDFDAFVSAVSLSQSTGGDLSTVLDRLAAGTRDREQFQRQFVAGTQSSRLTALLLAMAVPVLVLLFFILDADRFGQFIQSGFGLTLLVVAIALQLIGMIWIFRILRIDY